MKLIHETEDGANDRKFIKSQVEKRRRERMNRSLERLRTMLLQQPQQLTPLTHTGFSMQGATQRRMEKTEILEHTVLFLQNTVKTDDTRAGGGGQKHSFQDGFSTCLQKAAQFLGPEGKGLWLGAALDASFAARFTHSDSDSAGARSTTEAQSSSSLPHTKSILRMLRQKSTHRLHTRASGVNSFAHPYQLPVQQGFPRVPQQPQRHSDTSKQSSSQSLPSVGQPSTLLDHPAVIQLGLLLCFKSEFRGVGLQGSRMGEPHAAPHIHPCAIMSGGMNDICGPVLSQRCEARPPAEQHPSGVKSGQEVKEFNSSSHFKKTARPLLTLSEHLFGMNQENYIIALRQC
ncbi:uncharacterized protein LOC128366168 [Scomber japonicus]|uniref:uncharacterized protein LOC128366168 n=1 Tax=Scomber japonicus TaxID=13676 RepID=UPI0023051DF9|nr:uncharacterized protein LOC128366168 [Scomber japonicus]